MPGASIKAVVEGEDKILSRLQDLERNGGRRILMKALKPFAELIVNDAKGRRPTGGGRPEGQLHPTGLLRWAIGMKRFGRKNRATFIIGGLTAVKEVIGYRKRQGRKSNVGDPVWEFPALIAHLVERGHGGPHPAGPHSFLEAALNAQKTRGLELFRQKCASEIDRMRAA